MNNESFPEFISLLMGSQFGEVKSHHNGCTYLGALAEM